MRWRSVRLKHVARLNRRTLPDDTAPDYEFSYVDISSVGRGSLGSPPVLMSFEEAPSRARRIIRGGDTIVSSVRTYLRSVWPVDGEPDRLVASTGFVVITPGPQLDPGFLGWWAQSDACIEEIVARSVGVSYPAVNPGDVGNLVVRLPRLAAQREIAGFLDTETAQIDGLIEKKRRMIDVLRERLLNLMTHALEVRGLSWGTTLASPTGSRLPNGWGVAHLSVVLGQLTNGYVGPTRDILVEDGVKYVQSLHIKDGEIDFQRRPYYVSHAWHGERPRIHLRAGDVLLVQTGDIGQVAVVPSDFGQASCHALQIARVRRHLLVPDYLGLFLRSPFGQQSLLSRATGALHPHLEGGIRDIPVVLPPISTQEEVVREVAAGAERTAALKSRLLTQIELLLERRRALITAAVTGQLDVTKAAA